MYYLSPFKIGHYGIPSRLCLEEEDQGHDKYRLAATIGGDRIQTLTSSHPHKNRPPQVALPPILVNPQPLASLIHHKVGELLFLFPFPFIELGHEIMLCAS